ncbi:hypothetical protein T484DRAFT_1819535 [Baffinella frigidus]|nr:hypothetical protein T484DRAFT_1819535 [Cryptophyta sp. CCMP2293]
MRSTGQAQYMSEGRKVSLVTHSMGGLVAKYPELFESAVEAWITVSYPELFESAVEAWITVSCPHQSGLFESAVEAWIAVSCPHQGAGGKIFMEFLQGYNLGNIVIGLVNARVTGHADAEANCPRYEDAKRLALESPAVYELLPQETFPWKNPPYVSLHS